MTPSFSDHPSNNHKPLVLVVDDSASMREGISAILRHIGCEVETAINGRLGYEKARSCSPDLIISDLEMPEASGFDLLSCVRSDPTLTMVPFIMITGVADRASTRRAMELGADDYLTKPFKPEEVMSAARIRLDKQRNWRQATQALAASYSQGMMGILPHEFRTPLNSILGFAELMSMIADRGLTPTQTREFAETIQRAGKKLLSHTTRFLTLMEYQGLDHLPAASSRQVIEEDWIQSCIDQLMKEQIPQQSVDAQLKITPGMASCPADLLKTMIGELVGNALKFAQAGSTVLIKGEPTDDGYLLAIENQGVRFPVEKLSQIGAFVQFEREKHEQQGLGIGLAIVAHAARLSHTTFSMENDAGNTVRALLKLPKA